MQKVLKLATVLAVTIMGSTVMAHNVEPKHYDLLAVYNIAIKHNANYQAAVATFKANKENIPINLGALLPNATLGLAWQYNHADNPGAGNKTNYYNLGANSTYPLITLTQSIFNWSLWKTYTQAQYQQKADAITLAQEQQSLILSTSQSYFNILEAQDNLQFAQSSENWNKQLLEQTEQKYKVGLAAITDVQSTKAQYESSVASTVQADNTLKNAYATLYQITGQTIDDLDTLKDNFPFSKPSPDNMDVWNKIAMKNNLNIIQNQYLVQVAEDGVDIAWGQFLPSVGATATANRSLSYQQAKTAGSTVASVGVAVSWNVLNGGSDYATVKQAGFTTSAAKYTLKQTLRDTESSLKQSFLNVVSDISQVEAFKQSVIANESALKAMKTGYEVGTQTIVDLLNQQQLLFQAQEQFSKAKYAYINDLLVLKKVAGVLSIKDIANINQWLKVYSIPNTSSSVLTASKSK